MVDLRFIRRRKVQIYLLAALIAICCLILVACNNDISYSVTGDTVSEPTHFMAKFMLTLNNSIEGGKGSFGWTVVVFTIILRLILSPLDIWQKVIARKNSKAMERMRPQLEALQSKYGEDKQRLQQEQMALYKKEKYSTMGMCLPTIITMVVFFVVFAGFRQMVGYQFAKDYRASLNTFNDSISMQIEEAGYEDADGNGVLDAYDVPNDPEDVAFLAQALDKAQTDVLNAYNSDEQRGMRKWLWIHNIFVGDNWSKAVPDFVTVTGQKGWATSRLTGITKDEYERVMAKVLDNKDAGGYGKGGSWNGLLILPVLSIALSFLSTKLLSKSQGQPPTPPAGEAGAQGQSMKMMQWVMPIMMGVFGLLYSGAFALYMFTSSLTAILFQLGFNIIARLSDRSKGKKMNPNISVR